MKNGISVVVPTYNREQLLDMTLSSLSQQSLERERFEVIIVDDGSQDGTQSIVEKYTAEMTVKYFYQEDLGFRVAKARNIGILHADFDHVLFFDSGMLASSLLLEKHLAQQDEQPSDVLVGLSYGFDEFESLEHDIVKQPLSGEEIEPLFESLKAQPELKDCRESLLAQYEFDLGKTTNPWVIFWTCHALVKTESLREVGGFDEAFTSWGGEDAELALRLFKSNASFALYRDYDALHLPHEKYASACRQSSKENCHYIYQKHQCEQAKALTLLSWEQIL
ncbi:glycosyltransferase [Photobacterium sp. DNB22_13_2]